MNDAGLPANGLLRKDSDADDARTSWDFFDARTHVVGNKRRTLRGLSGWQIWTEAAGSLHCTPDPLCRKGGPFEEVALRSRRCSPEDGAGPLHDSILTLKDFVTPAECQQLIAAATRFCACDDSDSGLRRIECHPDGINLDGDTHALSHAILTRALRTLAALEPDLCAELFPCADPSELCDSWFRFSGDEPMLNRYTSGGAFNPHQDGHELTVLVPLSTSDVDFRGGGTAFWSEEEIGQDSTAAQGFPPSLVMRPAPGTGLFWRGHLTHAGLPVTQGMRHVFVASFNLHEKGYTGP
jgi:hypothetical protein